MPNSSWLSLLARGCCAAGLVLAVSSCGDDDPERDASEPGADAGLDTGDAGGGDANATDADPPEPSETTVPDGCNPLGAPYDCLLPYPSNAFLVPTDDGPRVLVPDVAVPEGPAGVPFRSDRGRAPDGFGIHAPILALAPFALDLSNAVGAFDDAAASLDAAHPSWLLRADTGERVPHWLEQDDQTDNPERRALIVRPLVPLEAGARYIVAFTDLRLADGGRVADWPVFAELRDGADFADAALDAEAARLAEQVLAPLEAAGAVLEDVQLAWDFTVRSRAFATDDILAVQSQTFAWLDERAVTATVEDVVRREDSVRVTGTVTAPLFMTSPDAGATYVRGDDDLPVYTELVEVPFLAIAALEVWDGTLEELPIAIQFGHGFFGSREEIDTGTHITTSREVNAVLFAVDGWGLANSDSGVIASDLVDGPNDVMRFVERIGQGAAHQLVLSEAITTALTSDVAFQRDGEPRYDAERLTFYGISNGHILGGMNVALSRHFDAAVLQSGGGSISFMMSRASPFTPLIQLLSTWARDPLDRQVFVAFVASQLDPIDALTWSPPLREAGAPPILLQLAIGDSTVPNLAGHLHARALGLSLLEPAPRAITNMPSVTIADAPASVLMEFDYGITEWPDRLSRPPSGDEANGVHEAIRNDARGVAQIRAFLRDGVVVHPCGDAACE